jgi:hypothetical protein
MPQQPLGSSMMQDLDGFPVQAGSGAPEQSRPMASSEQRDRQFLGEIDSVLERMNRNPSWAVGDPAIAGQPSFGKAVAGIEQGDVQGLEMLRFGTVRGTPAVSFMDEDGQEQVIKVTFPQWMGMIQSRDDAREQLRQERELDAKKQAFAGQFRALSSRVSESQDPIVGEYLSLLYDMDPGMAMSGLQSFIKARAGREDYTVYRGQQVPSSFAEAMSALDDAQADGRTMTFGRHAAALSEQGNQNAANAVNMAMSMMRPKGDRITPRSMTMPMWAMQQQNPMALAMVVDGMRQGLLPGMTRPVALPSVNNGSTDAATFEQFMQRFNEVSGSMGWAPAGEQDIRVIMDAIARVRGGLMIDQQVAAPTASAKTSSGKPSQPAPADVRGLSSRTRNALEVIAQNPYFSRLRSSDQNERATAFKMIERLYNEMQTNGPEHLGKYGVDPALIEEAYAAISGN